jgi:hypothetical protein
MPSSQALLLITTFARLFEHVQSGIDLGKLPLNFITLVRSGIGMQPFNALMTPMSANIGASPRGDEDAWASWN